MKIYLASFTGGGKVWGAADEQEKRFGEIGTGSRMLSYYAIKNKLAESEGSFNYFIKKGKNEKVRKPKTKKFSKTK